MRRSIGEFAAATVQGLCKYYGRDYFVGGLPSVPKPQPKPKPKPKPVPAIIIPPTVRRGSRGANVSKLQRALNGHGGKLVVDGDFGPKTEAMVKAFQHRFGLAVDGIVGPKTWKKVLS